jgi:hypothetical protein
LPEVQELGLEAKEGAALQALRTRLDSARHEIHRSLPQVQEHGLEEKLDTVSPAERAAADPEAWIRNGTV